MTTRPQRGRRLLLQASISLLVLVVGAAALAALTLSKDPPPQRQTKEHRPLVRVQTARTGPVQVDISGEGTVKPLRTTTLAAQVTGRVIRVSPALVDGGSFDAGEVLMEIDPTDYRLALDLARAQVMESETALQLTQEESKSAREEWKLLNRDSDSETGPPPPLVAKVPHLKQAQAALKASEARLRQAELDLERTKVRAPYQGRVDSKLVDVGQQVAKGASLAVIYSTEAAEITVQIEDSDLAWIAVPELTPGAEIGSLAVVRARFAGQERTWNGRVVRSAGKVDQHTRMVPVVVRVDHPYVTLPPLAAGMFVTVSIKGTTLAAATEVPRSALHGDEVWLVNDQGKLVFRPVKVVLRQGSRVVIDQGLPDGSRVVLTQLKTVSDGMAVRVADQPPAEIKPDADAPHKTEDAKPEARS